MRNQYYTIGSILELVRTEENIVLIINNQDGEFVYNKRPNFDDIPYDRKIKSPMNLNMYYTSAGDIDFLKCIIIEVD